MNFKKLTLSLLLCATTLVSADETPQYIKAKDIASLPRWEVYTGDESLLDPRTYDRLPWQYDGYNKLRPCSAGDATELSTKTDIIRSALKQNWSTIEIRNAGVDTLDGIGELLSDKSYFCDVHLQGNKLRDITVLSDVLAKNVNRLWLSNNQMTSLPEGLLSLTHLCKLCLDTNQLTSLAGIEALTSLEEKLCLRDNKITAVPELKALTKLTSIDLGVNPLQRIEQEWLPGKQVKDDESGEIIGRHYALREIMVDDEVELPVQWLEHCCRWMHVSDRSFTDDLGKTFEGFSFENYLPCVVRLSSGTILVACDSKYTGTLDEWINQAALEKEWARRPIDKFIDIKRCAKN